MKADAATGSTSTKMPALGVSSVSEKRALFTRPSKNTHLSGGLFKASVATKVLAKRRRWNFMRSSARPLLPERK